ncbi:hypothetical protein Tco_0786326 [Tanacetum coccineum]
MFRPSGICRLNGDALRKCILEGPYTSTIVTTPVVPATENSPAVPEQITVEIVMNMTLKNIAHFESEKEAIHSILTRIGDEIYSTVNACQTAQEMWEAIERLQQGESLNIQDVKTNLFWEFGQFTSHDGETIESYYTRFYKMMNEMIRNNLTVATMQLDEVSYHKLFDILKQYQKEVNELRAERMAKNANPLALVATAQTLQDPYYSLLHLIYSNVDSGCTTLMTGNLALLCNFVEYIWGTITITGVYSSQKVLLYHNIFLVGQFCDAEFWRLLSDNLRVLLEIFKGIELLTGGGSRLHNRRIRDHDHPEKVLPSKFRPDHSARVCYCASDQARRLKKPLKEVKKESFRYLRGTPLTWGLGIEGSGFELTAFSDANHAGCVDTRKSTFGGIQFLGDKLVSWMSKKQDCIAMSSAEAEYMALSASCAQSVISILMQTPCSTPVQDIILRLSFPSRNRLRQRFQYLVRRIGMRCLTPAELEVLTNESA